MPSLLLLVVLGTSCVLGCEPPGLPSAAQDAVAPALVPLTIVGPHAPATLRVEVAHDAQRRQRGLMGRRTLPQDGGMLFAFDETSEHVFWMHETPLALDMLFFNEQGLYVGEVRGAEPNTDTPRTCGAASRYVLEVRAGVTKTLGIQRGSRLALDALQLTSPHT